MEWLGAYLQDEQVGYIALAVIGGALVPAVLATLALGWFSWRASRLGRLARRFQGRHRMAEELMSSMEAEEKDLRRLMGEMERAATKG
ncbi:MAG TPA: hypothetical protein VFV70_05490 [Hyphomonadaceae bacterium]|nr:hypothetical protein [Hyphomonadaceae bacterium]